MWAPYWAPIVVVARVFAYYTCTRVWVIYGIVTKGCLYFECLFLGVVYFIGNVFGLVNMLTCESCRLGGCTVYYV